MSNCSSLLISYSIFLTREAPRYWSGYGACLGCLCLGIAATLFLRFMLKRENERRDKWTEEEVRAKYTEGSYHLRRTLTRYMTDRASDELLDLGDDSPLYRYVY